MNPVQMQNSSVRLTAVHKKLHEPHAQYSHFNFMHLQADGHTLKVGVGASCRRIMNDNQLTYTNNFLIELLSSYLNLMILFIF
jgi:succinylglutamate desuccinylase